MEKDNPKLTLKLPKVPMGQVKEVELVFDQKWFVCLSYEMAFQRKAKKKVLFRVLTLVKFIRLPVSPKRVMVSCRGKICEIQRLMSRCKRFRRKWRKYNRAKRYILSKSEAQLKDALHETTKQFVEWCLEHDVSHVVMGNPDGMQENTKGKRQK